LVAADKEQRDRVAQNSVIGPRRQLRDLQFAGILAHLLLPSHRSMPPSGKVGVYELALAYLSYRHGRRRVFGQVECALNRIGIRDEPRPILIKAA
jgi:hypothetical protein